MPLHSENLGRAVPDAARATQEQLGVALAPRSLRRSWLTAACTGSCTGMGVAVSTGMGVAVSVSQARCLLTNTGAKYNKTMHPICGTAVVGQ